MKRFSLMDEFVDGDKLKKSVEKFPGSFCWPIEKLFTTHFLIDPLGDLNEGKIFF